MLTQPYFTPEVESLFDVTWHPHSPPHHALRYRAFCAHTFPVCASGACGFQQSGKVELVKTWRLADSPERSALVATASAAALHAARAARPGVELRSRRAAAAYAAAAAVFDAADVFVTPVPCLFGCVKKCSSLSVLWRQHWLLPGHCFAKWEAADVKAEQARRQTLEAEIAAECFICMDRPHCAALAPCAHGGLCATCAAAVLAKPAPTCPLCRAPARSFTCNV